MPADAGTPRIIELEDQTLALFPLYEDRFDTLSSDWTPEGGALLSLSGGRLYINAARERLHFCTLWCARRFDGDTLVEYTARVEKGDGHTNINFFLFGSNPDGSPPLVNSRERTGDYGEYHLMHNYIFTFLNDLPPGSRNEKARIRFRKNPGFRLLAETWRSPVEKGRDYRFAVAVQGARMRFYVDGAAVFDYMDDDAPIRGGWHAFRTWKTHMSASLFRVSRILQK